MVSEIVELRQRYFTMYNFLYEIMGLARVAAEDIYFSKSKPVYVIPSDIPVRDVARRVLDLYTEALREFGNPTLLSFLIAIKHRKFEDY